MEKELKQLMEEARKEFDNQVEKYDGEATDATFLKVMKSMLQPEAVKDAIRYLSEVDEL